jgi:hypothetical protein
LSRSLRVVDLNTSMMMFLGFSSKKI